MHNKQFIVIVRHCTTLQTHTACVHYMSTHWSHKPCRLNLQKKDATHNIIHRRASGQFINRDCRAVKIEMCCHPLYRYSKYSRKQNVEMVGDNGHQPARTDPCINRTGEIQQTGIARATSVSSFNTVMSMWARNSLASYFNTETRDIGYQIPTLLT